MGCIRPAGAMRPPFQFNLEAAMKISMLTLGPVPAHERFILLDYGKPQRQQIIATMVFRRMVARLFPVPPGIWAFFVTLTKTDGDRESFSVALQYDSTNALGSQFADKVLSTLPKQWDAEARMELIWFDRSVSYHQRVAAGEMSEHDIPARFRGARPQFDPRTAGNAVVLLNQEEVWCGAR